MYMAPPVTKAHGRTDITKTVLIAVGKPRLAPRCARLADESIAVFVDRIPADFLGRRGNRLCGIIAVANFGRPIDIVLSTKALPVPYHAETVAITIREPVLATDGTFRIKHLIAIVVQAVAQFGQPGIDSGQRVVAITDLAGGKLARRGAETFRDGGVAVTVRVQILIPDGTSGRILRIRHAIAVVIDSIAIINGSGEHQHTGVIAVAGPGKEPCVVGLAKAAPIGRITPRVPVPIRIECPASKSARFVGQSVTIIVNFVALLLGAFPDVGIAVVAIAADACPISALGLAKAPGDRRKAISVVIKVEIPVGTIDGAGLIRHAVAVVIQSVAPFGIGQRGAAFAQSVNAAGSDAVTPGLDSRDTGAAGRDGALNHGKGGTSAGSGFRNAPRLAVAGRGLTAVITFRTNIDARGDAETSGLGPKFTAFHGRRGRNADPAIGTRHAGPAEIDESGHAHQYRLATRTD